MNWLFLRGLVREQRHWADFPERFRAVHPQARIFMLDFPGIGTEIERPSPWDLEGIMRDLRNRWRRLRESQPGPWALLSISLGSMAGVRWAEEFPADFERIVLINTSASGLSTPWRRLAPTGLADLGRTILRRSPVDKEMAILDMVSNLRQDRRELAEAWAAIAPSPAKRADIFARQVAAALRFSCSAPLAVPVLVLNSAKDRMVDASCSRVIAERLGAPLITHPEAGHDLPLDDGTWVAERVRDWLKA